jgi:hypothetical protein
MMTNSFGEINRAVGELQFVHRSRLLIDLPAPLFQTPVRASSSLSQIPLLC